MGQPTLDAAETEFDQWADAGRAESMADGHGGVTRAALDRWNLNQSHTVLDVGCGNGWAVREMMRRGAGTGIGVDLSPKMVALAQAETGSNTNCSFAVAAAAKLPFADGSVTHILNVESIYYYPDPAAALSEWARVTAPGGKLTILVDLYEENIATHVWVDALDIDVHLLSAASLSALLKDAGWRDVHTEQIIDPRPITPRNEFQTSKYWPSYEAYVSHRETGALVVYGTR
jgi:SAM-dependent methyltransferase